MSAGLSADSPSANDCGECGMCCKLLGIETLGKPAGRWCDHFKGGCLIYEDRPDECRGFQCAWLKAERLVPELRMGPEWRPDRARFVMYTERGGMRLNVVVEPSDPLAWKRPPHYAYIKQMSRRAEEGFELLVCVGDRRTVVFPHKDIDLGRVTPRDNIIVGFDDQKGHKVPYARVVNSPEETENGATAP